MNGGEDSSCQTTTKTHIVLKTVSRLLCCCFLLCNLYAFLFYKGVLLD